VNCGHRLIFCLHTLMITGGRTRSRTSRRAVAKSRDVCF
jgi:hypothetical protein